MPNVYTTWEYDRAATKSPSSVNVTNSAFDSLLYVCVCVCVCTRSVRFYAALEYTFQQAAMAALGCLRRGSVAVGLPPPPLEKLAGLLDVMIAGAAFIEQSIVGSLPLCDSFLELTLF